MIKAEIYNSNIEPENSLEIALVMDYEGILKLIEDLQSLAESKAPDHFHYMTESWAGWELSEDNDDSNIVIGNHVRFQKIPTECDQRKV